MAHLCGPAEIKTFVERNITMNDSDLDSILRNARIPQPPEDFWTEMPSQMARQLNRSRMEGVQPIIQPSPARFPRLAWGVATIFCIVTAFGIAHWRGQAQREAQREANSSQDVLANAQFVRETLATFPGQVRAIVEDQRGLNVILSATDNIPASSPLYVRVCNGKECAAMVTFSGQEIQIAGQKMTVLSDPHGGIILMGNDFAWSSSGPALAKNNLKITAKNLDPNTL